MPQKEQNIVLRKLWQRKVGSLYLSSTLHKPLAFYSAAWDFMQEHGNETGWDLTVLNPSFVCLSKLLILLEAVPNHSRMYDA